MKEKSKWLAAVVSGVGMVLVVGLSGCATEQPHRAMAEELIQSAVTKEDHEAIADHYDQEAKSAMEKADRMRRHLAAYEAEPYRGIPRQKNQFTQHCNALIGKYEAIARENEKLADLHRQMAAGN
jgi:hypothetical protein